VLLCGIMTILEEIAIGRTDLVFEFVADGNSANSVDGNRVSLMQHCAYYGDVSAMKFLLANGATLDSLGQNLGLHAASFHGHWRLCKFLLEHGADANFAAVDTGETALHSALCTPNRIAHNLVVKVLLAHGANPNTATKHAAETGCFMRDCRTKGETALHRAAAFGDEEVIQNLLDGGAKIDVKDMNGDTPLSWASWYARPTPVLRKLLHGDFRIHPEHAGMAVYLQGKPKL
jgi:ankyrin repeat protein